MFHWWFDRCQNIVRYNYIMNNSVNVNHSIKNKEIQLKIPMWGRREKMIERKILNCTVFNKIHLNVYSHVYVKYVV